MLREANYYARTAWGLYRLLRAPVPDFEGRIRRQLENREKIFLDTLRRVVFANPGHPYHRMFRLAGCRYEDLEERVNRDGLESALEAIRREGVYLAHDEFKGKTAIVRSGQHIPADENSFLNPLVSGLVESRSSGSRSQGTLTRQSTEYRLYKEGYELLAINEFGLGERARILVKPILPSMTGLSTCLKGARFGNPIKRWFAAGGTWGDSGHYRTTTRSMVLLCRVLGARVPSPDYLPANDFSPVADWIARRRAEGVACTLDAFVSPAVRVAAAAMEKGLDIRGTLFLVSGEALTDAKRAVIEATGSEVYSIYWIHEVGPVGFGCRQMKTGNCVHLFRDSVAAITYRRCARFSDVRLDSLLFTTLLPFAPRVLINAEMDDSGVIGPAPCHCVFTRAGFTECVRDIYSFGKLTGQGMTLVGSDIVRILEEALPARFGGAPGDYQLVEREGEAQTQLTLRVSPRLRIASTAQIARFFLDEIRKYYGGTLASRIWRHAEGLEVIAAEPFATASGKVLSLHLMGSGVREGAHAS